VYGRARTAVLSEFMFPWMKPTRIHSATRSAAWAVRVSRRRGLAPALPRGQARPGSRPTKESMVRLTNLFDYGAEEGTVSIARGGAARRGFGELASECVVGERSHLLKLLAPPEELELSEPAPRQGWRPNATVDSARRGGGAAGRRGGGAAGRRGGGAAGRAG